MKKHTQINISFEARDLIKEYCTKNNLVMAGFIEKVLVDYIKSQEKAS